MPHALQVYLDDADFESVEAWANARGWTLSQTVRVALKALTRAGETSDPLLAASGMIEGLPPDLSQSVDLYLNLSYAAEPLARYDEEKPKRRSKKPVRR
jgi:hypothetical protein